MANVVRAGELLQTCLRVLEDAGGPLDAAEVFQRVERELDLTPYELAPAGGSPRWRTHLGFHTGDAVTLGWMTKIGGWAITEAGEAVLEAYDADQLMSQLRRQMELIRGRRERALKELDERAKVVAQAIGVVNSGYWTSYDDLAGVAGAETETIRNFIAHTAPAGSHRVLDPDGSIPNPTLLPARLRRSNLTSRLQLEGIAFGEDGRALQSQRLTTEALVERLRLLEEEERVDPDVLRRAWFVRATPDDGADLTSLWIGEGCASLPSGASLRNVMPPVSRDRLRKLVDSEYQHMSYAAREAKVREFDAFLNRMRPGDYILTYNRDGRCYVGRITGRSDYALTSDPRSNLRRKVEWQRPDSELAYDQLPLPLPQKLYTQADVVELTEYIDLIQPLLIARGLQPDRPTTPDQPDRNLTFPDVSVELAEHLLVDQAWLTLQADLLWEHKQLIFHGPPGTGKTFLARRLAARLAGDNPSAVKLVQFHPSYTYEDFFHGYRPVSSGGRLSYELRPGPFRNLVEDAEKHRSDPYILIIDEINRANLATVFGELYFLLEYRDAAVDLLYSEETSFTLPDNVFILGTMNTADRSIGQLDAAMRRRFAFSELHPSKPPVRGLLRRWLDGLAADARKHNTDTPELLEALNAELEYGQAIGPSYLMREQIYSNPDGLAHAWQSSVLPLLAEYHYGEPESALERYDLTALRSQLREGSEDEP